MRSCYTLQMAQTAENCSLAARLLAGELASSNSEVLSDLSFSSVLKNYMSFELLTVLLLLYLSLILAVT